MHADHGMVQAVGHLGDGQGGGVGGKNGLGLAHGVQLAEQGLLGAHVFLDALNDEIRVGAGGLFLHQHVGHDGVGGGLFHPALVHPLLERGGQLVLVLLGGRHGAGVHQGGVALRREDLSDAAAHRARAKNRYLHDCSSCYFVKLWVLLSRLSLDKESKSRLC